MVSLLFGKRYPRTRIGHIELDATISESHDFSATVTQFPVENGTVISDHIFNQPIRLSLECLISDSPLSNSGNPLVPIINNLTSFFSVNSGPTRSNSVFEELMRLYEKREIFQVSTGLRIYKDMAITSLSIPRTTNTGQSLLFRMEMMQIRFASTIDISYRFNRLVEGQTPPVIREQIADNSNYPLFAQDPTNSFKDQGQSFIDVGTQALQPMKQPAIDVANVVVTGLALAGLYRLR